MVIYRAGMSVREIKTNHIFTIERVHIRGYDLILYMNDGSIINANNVEVI